MIADYNTMPRMFWFCNSQYFDHKLPNPKYGILHTFKQLGRFQYLNGWKGKPNKHMTILMSDYYDFDEETFRSVMVHEMIHYCLLLNGTDTKVCHGEAFKAKAQEFNEKYGLNIPITYDITNIPNSPHAPKRTWWRCFHF